MLTITRKGFFSRDLEVRDGIAPVAEINMSSFRERAELRVGTELYEARAFRPEVDRALQVFAIWIVAVLFRRAAMAAASG